MEGSPTARGTAILQRCKLESLHYKGARRIQSWKVVPRHAGLPFFKDAGWKACTTRGLDVSNHGG